MKGNEVERKEERREVISSEEIEKREEREGREKA